MIIKLHFVDILSNYVKGLPKVLNLNIRETEEIFIYQGVMIAKISLAGDKSRK